jgi:hypothetical protein
LLIKKKKIIFGPYDIVWVNQIKLLPFQVASDKILGKAKGFIEEICSLSNVIFIAITWHDLEKNRINLIILFIY